MEYKKYLDGIDIAGTHNGYFAIDKKSKRLIDPKMNKTEMKKGESSDVDAYDLILKDKERLLSFEEPTRFIFSHSALREGWDNPNVFVICTLKHSDNAISRRQEVGRGLRIAVNKLGDRQDNSATVHQTNVLTVVANESYKDFVKGLQKDISESLSERHIYDYVITDSKTERTFVEELDTSTEVVVYAKLPKGFFIPTPVGTYNPDWAISFKEGSVKHVYFVAETKGSMASMELREIEKTKIKCARKFFDEINQKIDPKKVKYDVVDGYGKLMDIVGVGTVSPSGGAC